MQLRRHAAQMQCTSPMRPPKLAVCELQSTSRLAGLRRHTFARLSLNSSRHLCRGAGSYAEEHIQPLHTLPGPDTPGNATTDSSSSYPTVADVSDKVQQHNADGPRLQEGAADGSITEQGTEQIPRRRRSVNAAMTQYPDHHCIWRSVHPSQLRDDYSNICSRGLPRRCDLAPGVKRTGEAAAVLIARQLRDLMENPIPGIQVEPDVNDTMIWHVQMSGPEGSPYEGGKFRLMLYFTNEFPDEQPNAAFVTPIWHPNVFCLPTWVDIPDLIKKNLCAYVRKVKSGEDDWITYYVGNVCMALGTDDS